MMADMSTADTIFNSFRGLKTLSTYRLLYLRSEIEHLTSKYKKHNSLYTQHILKWGEMAQSLNLQVLYRDKSNQIKKWGS